MLDSVAQNAAQVFAPELDDWSQTYSRPKVSNSLVPTVHESGLLLIAENFDFLWARAKVNQSDFLEDFIFPRSAPDIKNYFKNFSSDRTANIEPSDLLTGAIAGTEFTPDRDILINHQAFLLAEVRTRAGRVNTQADRAVLADFSRPLFNLDGTGVSIGVISDSYDAVKDDSTNAINDINSGDLPGRENPNGRLQPVQVLQEGNSLFLEDEGRAMLQLIHDIAPGAKLLFHSAGDGSDRAIANAVRALANAGADIIVDDIGAYDEPFFQDGLSAQAIDQVAAQGVVYFSAAGNDARGYQSPFRDSGRRLNPEQFTLDVDFFNDDPGGFFGGTAHDFDPGPGVQIFQPITLEAGEEITLLFQWDDPFASVSPGVGAKTNLDIYLLDSSRSRVVGGSTNLNIGRNPQDDFTFTNFTGNQATFNLLIVRSAGPNPGLLQLAFLNPPDDFRVPRFNGPSIYGHANAAGAIAVGAADYRQTPAFGVNPPILEPFSSVGPTPILFDPAGNRLPEPIIRSAPLIVAPNKTNTTFFVPGRNPDQDQFPNFAGTSAAAPHAAGIAALMLQARPTAKPAEIAAALSRTAIDMDDPLTPGFDVGFDFATGFGLVQADRAVGLLEIFNESFYLAQNPGVRSAVNRKELISGFEHFAKFGQFEGRDPSPQFSNASYLAQNPDVAAAVKNGVFRSGFDHFIQFGQLEGRNPQLLFDPAFYLAQNPDVVTAINRGTYRSAFEHFIKVGQLEGRKPSLLFDERFYLAQNPDIRQAVNRGVFRSGFEHFTQLGQFEGRAPSDRVTEKVYLQQNPDVATAVTRGVFPSGISHFVAFGRRENRIAV